jgi:hypothetical protein
MRIAILSAAALVATAAPAAASVGLFCTGPAGVTFNAPLGGGVGLSVLAATVEADGRIWTTETALEDPQAIVPAQVFALGDMMLFDFADPNVEANVVEVRLFSTSEGVIGGTLQVTGVGAWVISCDIG